MHELLPLTLQPIEFGLHARELGWTYPVSVAFPVMLLTVLYICTDSNREFWRGRWFGDQTEEKYSSLSCKVFEEGKECESDL